MWKKFLLCMVVSALLGANLASNVSAALAEKTTAGQESALQSQIDLARMDIVSGRGFDAYQRLIALESEYAGEISFDYWLGVAAARSGEWFEASLALQRVLVVQPGHAGARLELVGVLFSQNQLDQAEEELQILQQQVDEGGAPEEAMRAIARYQAIIDQRRQGARDTSSNAFVGVDYGYDSNFSNFPEQFDIFRGTLFEGVAVFDAASTSYLGLRSGYSVQRFISENSFIDLALAGSSRANMSSDASELDTSLINASFKYGYRRSNNALARVGFDVGAALLNNRLYRKSFGLSISDIMPIGENKIWQNRLVYSVFEFDDSRFNFISYGVETQWRQELPGPWLVRFEGEIDYEETMKIPGRQGGDMLRLQGASTLGYRVTPNHTASAQLILTNRRYQNEGFSVFNFGRAEKRKDETMIVRMNWNSRLNEHLQFNAFAQWREQKSNIGFFNVDQVLMQVGVTYVF